MLWKLWLASSRHCIILKHTRVCDVVHLECRNGWWSLFEPFSVLKEWNLKTTITSSLSCCSLAPSQFLTFVPRRHCLETLMSRVLYRSLFISWTTRPQVSRYEQQPDSQNVEWLTFDPSHGLLLYFVPMLGVLSQGRLPANQACLYFRQQVTPTNFSIVLSSFSVGSGSFARAACHFPKVWSLQKLDRNACFSTEKLWAWKFEFKTNLKPFDKIMISNRISNNLLLLCSKFDFTH